MKFKAFVIVMLFQAVNCYAATCRDAVVDAYASIDIQIDRDSFSTANFEDISLGVEDFNQLSPEEQNVIYNQIKPMEVMVESTIFVLNSKLSRYLGTFYEIYMTEKIKLWRKNIAKLRSCEVVDYI